jgi:hypothetical protein
MRAGGQSNYDSRKPRLINREDRGGSSQNTLSWLFVQNKGICEIKDDRYKAQ